NQMTDPLGSFGPSHPDSGGYGGSSPRGKTDIRAATVLPARRTPITLTTEDGLRLIGELALPEHRDPAATLICLHPLPTHGGMMDSHVYRKAAYRLPALADLAVLRFNTRGTESEQGKSEGEFGGGETERLDVEAAVRYAVDAGLPDIWLSGWSFGTELTLRWGLLPGVQGGIRQAADRPGARVRRLPASGRGTAALRPGPQGAGDRRGRRQAPVGGRE